MRSENLVTRPLSRKNYVRTALVAFGAVAMAASTYIAWPALTHLGTKLV